MQEALKELIDKDAIPTNNNSVYLPSYVGGALYRSGLVERFKLKQHYRYRIKELKIVQELLAKQMF